MNRRDFLRGAGAFIVGAKLLPACGDDAVKPDVDASLAGRYAFPQGLASGDPRSTSVVLWTRAIQKADPLTDVELKLQVATDEGFASVVADMTLTATGASDHAVRILVTALTANTTYYYRFTAGIDQTSGRTRTAPASTADVQVNLAWVSCQDYQSGHFGAYQQMIADDDARPEADRIQFVLHMGDVIYETIDEPSQRAVDDAFETKILTNEDGSERIPRPFPSGGGTTGAAPFARTTDDYRHLYKTFFSDPNLQAARARWPFIYTWDDHEFTNDYWQSQANYIDGTTLDEGSQQRKVNANHAWFEYIPAQLTGAVGPTGVTQNAKDFTPATVTNARFTAPDANNFVPEANNVAAVGSITIYRSLRWGKHVEIVMTDERSYRSDHAIPEDTVALINAAAGQTVFFDPRNFLPLPLVTLMDLGSVAGQPTISLGAGSIPNPRNTFPIGTMLGKPQKDWWKATMLASDATWKLWGNEVPMMRMRVTNPNNALGFERVLDGDAWDGYPTERKELIGYLVAQNIKNVVLLSGDIHAHFAGIVVDDYDVAVGSRVPVATELVSAGISSNSLFSFYESATRGLGALRGLVTVDASATAGGSAFTENINLLVTKGTAAASVFAQTKSLAATTSFQDPTANPHIKYVDTNAQGYGYAKVTATEVQSTLVTINRPVGAPSTTAPGIKRAAAFVIPKDNPGGMTGPTITGTKPFPLT